MAARRNRLIPICIGLILLCGCTADTGTAGNGPATETVTIRGRTFELEIAADAASQARGLGGRETIDPDGGMLFVFPQPEYRSFWMKGCLTDIDVIFLDGRGAVTAVHEMKVEPPRGPNETLDAYETRLKGYSSRYPSQFAIELAPGTIRELGIGVDEVIDLDLKRLKALAP